MRRVFAAAALSAIATVALFVSADAQPQPQAGESPGASKDNACFFQRDVSSFSAAGEHTVYLRVGVNDYYRLDLTSDCQNLDFCAGPGPAKSQAAARPSAPPWTRKSSCEYKAARPSITAPWRRFTS